MCKCAITHKNDAFVAKIVNTPLTKISMAIFAFDERLPTSATLSAIVEDVCITKKPGYFASFCFSRSWTKPQLRYCQSSRERNTQRATRFIIVNGYTI